MTFITLGYQTRKTGHSINNKEHSNNILALTHSLCEHLWASQPIKSSSSLMLTDTQLAKDLKKLLSCTGYQR